MWFFYPPGIRYYNIAELTKFIVRKKGAIKSYKSMTFQVISYNIYSSMEFMSNSLVPGESFR